jgi:hypothetical protein
VSNEKCEKVFFFAVEAGYCMKNLKKMQKKSKKNRKKY